MCRKNYFRGFCLLTFGIGLIVGHCLESWLLCCFGGMLLMVLGICIARKR